MTDEEIYREEWMTDEQWEAALFLRDLFRGFHHIQGKIEDASPTGIKINTRATNWAATFDFDGLTRAVFMAHERCIRFEITPSGPGMLKLYIHKRKGREGPMHARHPTLQEALDAYTR